MTDHRALALAALAELRIFPPTSYSWCGGSSAALAPAVARAMSAEVARELLLFRLQQELYANFYCRGFPAPAEPVHGRSSRPRVSAFGERLARANSGRQTLQTGWEVQRVEGNRVVVTRNGLSLWVAPDGIVSQDPGGNRVGLSMPCELRKASPGFYVALGEAPHDGEDRRRLVRLYWHLTSAAAPLLLERLTSALNDLGVPFQLKVIDDPDRYDRCDAGVLYVDRRHYATSAPAIAAAHARLARELRAGVPALTKQLAPGLGLAEDPGDGQSFGLHRAGLLARAAVRAHELGCVAEAERAGILHEEFAQAGLDIDRPYLNEGSTDDYALAELR